MDRPLGIGEITVLPAKATVAVITPTPSTWIAAPVQIAGSTRSRGSTAAR
ncbi:hypothetical protein [Sulfitobacter faviae]|nr:hypothetical protein [Sulfitobacter faviae]